MPFFEIDQFVCSHAGFYVAAWTTFYLLTIVIVAQSRAYWVSKLPSYFKMIFVPWKLWTFLPAFLFVTFAGHFTDDETWDVISGGEMSVLTFLTAPCAVGLYYRASMRKMNKRCIIVAIALCLFSSAWSYDLYLYIRDGAYSPRWLGNLTISPVIYIVAGIFWSLEVTNSGKPSLAFIKNDWPEPAPNKNWLLLLPYMIPIIAIAVLELIAFVRWHF